MKLSLLLFGALIGVVYSESAECYIEVSTECNKRVFESTTSFEFCSLQPRLADCLREASTKCGLDLPSLEKVQTNLKDICREGSALNKKVQKHKDCLMKKALTVFSCYEGYIDLKNPPKTPEEILDVQKKVCKDVSKIETCFLNLSEKVCGGDARALMETIYSTSMQFQRELCDAVILHTRAYSEKRSEPVQLPVSFGPLEFML